MLPSSAAAAGAEQEAIETLNEVRRAHGLAPLRESGSLNDSSGDYARRMLRHDFFGHGPSIDVAGAFRSAGETLAYHTGWNAQPRRTVTRWMNSPGHRAVLDYVVLDPQHTFDSITLAALDQSDEIVLILTLDIPAIRSTQRALEIFDRLGYPRKKVRIVVNRWSKQIDLDLRQVEKFLGEPVVGFVPSDYQTAVSSINLGTPLVQAEPSSKIAMEIRRIAGEISLGVMPLGETRPRRSLWNSFMKKQPAQQQFNLQTSMEKV